MCSTKWRAFYSNHTPVLSLSVFDRELEIHAMRLGPGKHLKGRKLMGGLVKPEEVRFAFCLRESTHSPVVQFDYFHELIITQELARMGARGFADGLLGGKVIGLPPVINFGSPELKAKVSVHTHLR
jgi:hypothetical protein